MVNDEVSKNPTPAESAIIAMPERAGAVLQWRAGNCSRYGLERGRYSSYRRALATHIRSQDSVNEMGRNYDKCVGGSGPFVYCRVLEDPANRGTYLLNGAYTNCDFGGHGSRYSFYVDPGATR